MPISTQSPVAKDDLALESVKLALAYLEAAESLNIEMHTGRTPASFYHGQPVVWLAFHALELFLKGFIQRLSHEANPTGHSIPELIEELQKLDSTIVIPHPFGFTALPDYPAFVSEAKRLNRTLHEQFRYPADKTGAPWPGTRAFSADMFQKTLEQLRVYLEKAYDKVFQESES